MPLRQSASTIGHGEPCGISAISVGSASIPDRERLLVADVEEADPALRAAARPRPRSASSHFGYGLEIVGMTAKLYSGGGEGIDHSSVGPRHGSRGAGGPRNQLYDEVREQQQDPERGEQAAERLDHVVRTSSPCRRGTCRRAAASRAGPTMCIGKKRRFVPTKITQKLIWPGRSKYIRPVTFGNQ